MKGFYILVATLIAAGVHAEPTLDNTVGMGNAMGMGGGSGDGTGEEKELKLPPKESNLPVATDSTKKGKAAKVAPVAPVESSKVVKSAKSAKSVKTGKTSPVATGRSTKLLKSTRNTMRHAAATCAAVTAFVALSVFAGVLWRARYQEEHWTVDVEEDSSLLTECKASYA